MLSYQNTPVHELLDPGAAKAGIQLLIKREDLNHPTVSGNKWWKLKYNLEAAMRQGQETLLTFGGAFSNHIYATAAAARELGLKSIGIIRGEETSPLNPTLTFAESCGMKLKYISREHYKHKTEVQFIESLHEEFGKFYLIPEGGTNTLALKGCTEYARQVLAEIEFDYLCMAVGTGGTIAGILRGLHGGQTVLGFSSLKGGAFLEDDIKVMLADCEEVKINPWKIETDYHFGGYGKRTCRLDEFIRQWDMQHIPLDPVYTAKALFGVLDLAKKGFFKRDSTVLFLHTGGLQGRSQ